MAQLGFIFFGCPDGLEAIGNGLYSTAVEDELYLPTRLGLADKANWKMGTPVYMYRRIRDATGQHVQTLLVCWEHQGGRRGSFIGSGLVFPADHVVDGSRAVLALHGILNRAKQTVFDERTRALTKLDPATWSAVQLPDPDRTDIGLEQAAYRFSVGSQKRTNRSFVTRTPGPEAIGFCVNAVPFLRKTRGDDVFYMTYDPDLASAIERSEGVTALPYSYLFFQPDEMKRKKKLDAEIQQEDGRLSELKRNVQKTTDTKTQLERELQDLEHDLPGLREKSNRLVREVKGMERTVYDLESRRDRLKKQIRENERRNQFADRGLTYDQVARAIRSGQDDPMMGLLQHLRDSRLVQEWDGKQRQLKRARRNQKKEREHKWYQIIKMILGVSAVLVLIAFLINGSNICFGGRKVKDSDNTQSQTQDAGVEDLDGDERELMGALKDNEEYTGDDALSFLEEGKNEYRRALKEDRVTFSDVLDDYQLRYDRLFQQGFETGTRRVAKLNVILGEWGMEPIEAQFEKGLQGDATGIFMANNLWFTGSSANDLKIEESSATKGEFETDEWFENYCEGNEDIYTQTDDLADVEWGQNPENTEYTTNLAHFTWWFSVLNEGVSENDKVRLLYTPSSETANP